jgi:hypothetical protein
MYFLSSLPLAIARLVLERMRYNCVCVHAGARVGMCGCVLECRGEFLPIEHNVPSLSQVALEMVSIA